MLGKKEENKEKVKDKAYYVVKIEEIRARPKVFYLIARGDDKEEETYQSWSSRSNKEEMRNPTHGEMYTKL